MDDRDVIARLRAGLDELTADVDDTPPLLPPATRSVGGADRRRVRWLAVAGVAVAAVVAVGMIVVLRANGADEVHTSSLVPATSTSAPATTATSATTTTTVAPTTTVAVAASDLVDGTWVIVDVDGTPIPRLLLPWFTLGGDGSVRGFDGCRRFTAGAGSWALEGGRLRALTEVSSEATFACENDPFTHNPFDGVGVELERTASPDVVRLRTGTVTLTARQLDPQYRLDATTLRGRWTDGFNTFDFLDGGVLRFSRLTSCDGHFGFVDAMVQVDFADCTSESVSLTAVVFRSSIPYRLPGSAELLLEGDAGVSRLEPAD